MPNINGIPNALKQVNLTAVRRAIREKGSATRAEIVQATGISVTTVRTLLTEMQNDNEIYASGCDESAGGRKAVRYQLNKLLFFGVVFCLDCENIRYLTVNICGEILEKGSFAAGNDIPGTVCSFLDRLTEKMEIRAIGIGVPGIVNGMGYQRKNPNGGMEEYPVGELLRKKYGIPVILENDLNAITLGFGRCYLKRFPEEKCENANMAYIYFDKDCLSAGFLSDGRLLRGFHNFVGELGLFPVNESRTLDDLLASPLNDLQYSKTVAKLIAGICCVLNPEYIAVGGENFRDSCLSLIAGYLDEMLPKQMAAELLYAKDKWQDYYEGMAYLTAEQIFADVLLIQE